MSAQFCLRCPTRKRVLSATERRDFASAGLCLGLYPPPRQKRTIIHESCHLEEPQESGMGTIGRILEGTSPFSNSLVSQTLVSSRDSELRVVPAVPLAPCLLPVMRLSFNFQIQIPVI